MNKVHPVGRLDELEAPCETGETCQFEDRCGKSPRECGEYYDSLVDQVVDAAIDEARLRRKEHE